MVDLTTEWTPEDRVIAKRVRLTNMTITSDWLDGMFECDGGSFIDAALDQIDEQLRQD